MLIEVWVTQLNVQILEFGFFHTGLSERTDASLGSARPFEDCAKSISIVYN